MLCKWIWGSLEETWRPYNPSRQNVETGELLHPNRQNIEVGDKQAEENVDRVAEWLANVVMGCQKVEVIFYKYLFFGNILKMFN